ncbi:disulfide bond formation protein B [Candidatus Saccharibacteria bacterium]|jgi:disulfide bond formation protein DsbB|nr:disulfide bond formation protein B [Candidatus Saccharibacteria bacterium]
MESIKKFKIYRLVSDNAHYLIWSLGVASVFGSLYFSEVEKLPPCNLCWWLRIFLYPVAFIMSVAIVRRDFKSSFYMTLSLAVPATLLSFYHSLLQWGIVKEANVLCSTTAAVPCDKPDFLFLGFITIPFLGFLTSLAILILSLIGVSRNPKKKIKPTLTLTA